MTEHQFQDQPLPDGWVVLNEVIISEVLSPEGEQFLVHRLSGGTKIWTALGMMKIIEHSFLHGHYGVDDIYDDE